MAKPDPIQEARCDACGGLYAASTLRDVRSGTEAPRRLCRRCAEQYEATQAPTAFIYSRWRHGGWYVENVRYPSGAIGCVSRDYPDRKWRIACDRRPGDHTYATRDAAALAEWHLAQAEAKP